jgi:hypothetical protein
MSGKRQGSPVNKKATRIKRFMTFQESAKKFKPGPVAPRESDADRPDMSGDQPLIPTAVRSKRALDDQAHGRMSDGAPGKFKKMPGESAKS